MDLNLINSSWHSYPSIYNVGHGAVSEIFSDNVLIEEKVDGSQFSFGIFNGEIHVRSKGAQLDIKAPEKMFSIAVDTVASLSANLKDGYTYRAEYLQKPKHNTLVYDRTPKNNIIIFDINPAQEIYLSYEEKEKEAQRLGLEIVPRLYDGKVTTSDQLLALLDTKSILGGVNIEGIVIKNYARFGKDKKALMAKFVSESFKEKHTGDWKSRNPNYSDVIELLVTELKTNARWEKAVQHLRDFGKLTSSPKDIGMLIKEVQEDAMKEEVEYIKDRLYNLAKNKISRGITCGLPEWYKEYLLKSAFLNKENTDANGKR